MSVIQKIALAILIIGGLNWGLIGLFNLNLVTLLIKSAMINNLIYIVIGLASIICVTYFFEEKRTH